MARMTIEQGLEFDDLLIIPRHSNVISRSDVNYSQDILLKDGSKIILDVPIFASPMEGITGAELVTHLGKLGGIGILHRGFKNVQEWNRNIRMINYRKRNFGISFGISTNIDWIKTIVEENERIKVLCVDTANGHRQELLDYIYKLAVSFDGYPLAIMSGNVVTGEGALNLANAGTDIIRVGIGSGSFCTTRNVTGVGMPQITALSHTKMVLLENGMDNVYTVSDGGIRYAGDMCKALVFSDFVMLGGQLATTFESDNKKGRAYGMASKTYQEKVKGSHISIEGIERKVERTNSLKQFLEMWMGNLSSSMSYVDAYTLKDFRNNVRLIKTGTGSIDHEKMNYNGVKLEDNALE